MMRILVFSICGTLLAACSGSNRVEDLVPAWANTPPRPTPHYAARKNGLEGHSKPDARAQEEPRTQEAAGPQEVAKSVVQSLHEE
jgi:hypothetical protein